jgi:hypothetical protein
MEAEERRLNDVAKASDPTKPSSGLKRSAQKKQQPK